MKPKRPFTLSFTALPAIIFSVLALADPARGIGIVIDGTTGNGGFVNATADINTLSITGWTALTNFWVDSGNTPLATPPFGADTVGNSHIIQLHNDAGCVFTSTTKFNLAEGDGVNCSFDYKTGGTGGDTTLTVSLIDTDTNTTIATLGSLSSTADAQANFVQKNLSASGLAAENNLALRFTLSDPAALGKDFHIDRVHLETVAGTSTNQYWDTNGATAGAGSVNPAGNWSDANWSASSAGDTATATWSPGNTAIFAAGSDATGPYVVTLGAAQSAASIRVQEGDVELSGGALSLGAAGVLQADGGAMLRISSALTAADLTTTGNIFLNGSNTVSGGLQIVSNTLTLGSALSVGNLAGAGNMNINGQVFSAGGAADTIYPGLISGAGTFSKQGAGKLQLTNLTNSFSGNVSVNSGILETGAAAGNGIVSYLGAVNHSRTITVNTGGNLRYPTANVFGGTGKSAAALPFTVIDGGILTTLHFNIIGDLTLKNSGSLTNSSTATGLLYGGFQFLGNIHVTGSGAGTFIQNGTSTRPDHLLGAATTTFAVEDITGSPAADLTISSVLADGSGDYPGISALTKSGPGTLVLAATNTYTGTTTVTGGILAVGGTSIVDSTTLAIDGGKVEPTGIETVNILRIGGTQQASGTWGATGSGATHINDAHFSGTAGVVNVTTGPPAGSYASWISGFPGVASATGFKQDADHDGVPNGIEHLLGTDPSVTGNGIAPFTLTGNTLTFRHAQTNTLASDVTKVYEWSTDLVAWHTSGVPDALGTTVTVVSTTLTDNAAPENDLIEVTFTASGTPAAKLFVRLAAHQLP